MKIILTTNDAKSSPIIILENINTVRQERHGKIYFDSYGDTEYEINTLDLIVMQIVKD